MSKENQPQKSSRILLIGDSCIDEYIFGTCDRISPEAPVPIFCESRREIRPGMSLNVQANLQNLGNDVTLLTSKKKGKKTRYVSENTLHHLLRVDQDIVITPLEVYEVNENRLSTYDAVIISDYNKGFLTRHVANAICRKCAGSQIPVFVDTKKKDTSCFCNAILKVNQYEKALITKYPLFYTLITTLGANGAMLDDEVFPAIENDVVDGYGRRDVCGAGDTFMSALVHKYLKNGRDLRDAVVFANKCASVVVSRFGTVAIKTGDVE